MIPKRTGKTEVYEDYAELVEWQREFLVDGKPNSQTFWKLSVSGNEEPEEYESAEAAKREIDRRLGQVE